MKKLLLSVAALATIFSASAQDKFVIYDGSATDILKGNAYGFNGFDAASGGITKSDSTALGNTFWYLEGSVVGTNEYYVGGSGNANFQAKPNVATSFGIDLKVLETASFSFNYVADVEANIDVDLEQQLFNAKGEDSTVLIGTTKINLKPTLTPVLTEVVKPVSVFKNGTADLTAADFAKVSKFTIKVSLTTKTGTIKAAFDDITFTDGTTSVSDALLNTFANENVTVYNMQGAVVTSGTAETLNLTTGFYILKSATHSQKVCIK